MQKIRARCHTNLDEFQRVEWPEYFLFPPRIGDRVEGWFSGNRSEPRSLKGVGVEHARDRDNGEPIVRVELH